MKKRILFLIYYIVVFAIAGFVAFRMMNRGSTDLTARMEEATLPVITLKQDGNRINPMHGYVRRMQIPMMRGTILSLPKKRTLEIEVERFGAEITGISFEVRTADGENLVEEGKVEDLRLDSQRDRIAASFALKDLITPDEEYMLVLILTTPDAQEIRYYSRIVLPSEEDGYHLTEKLDFVKRVHEMTFEKDTALRSFLEPNSDGANASYAYTNIHSAFSRVTWGDLQILDRTTPFIRVHDLHAQTATVGLEYRVTLLTEDGNAREYRVREDYVVRYTERRMYLLDFERRLTYLFDGDEQDFGEHHIFLSYTSQDMQVKESSDGGTIAFVNAGRLFLFRSVDNRLVRVFGFYDETQDDVRTAWDGCEIRILHLDEGGNIRFLVSGYMSRGRHEGTVGTVLCHYDATVNTVEELLYLPDTCSEEILKTSVQRLSYMNSEGTLFTILGNSVHAVHPESRTGEVVVQDIVANDYRVSDGGGIVAWQRTPEDARIQVVYLTDGHVREITARAGEAVVLLGFMGEDVIYGCLRPEDIRNDSLGNPVYAMYAVVIEDETGSEMTRYELADTYITGISVADNQITLQRAIRENERYQSIRDDQIVSSDPATGATGPLTLVDTANGQAVQIALRDRTDGEKTRRMTAGEILFEGERQVAVSMATARRQYFVYDCGEVVAICDAPSQAVETAYRHFGQVVDETGRDIYYRGNLELRNQIMRLTEAVAGRDFSGMDSSAACLSVMLEYEGQSRDVEAMLSEGRSAAQILTECLPEVEVLPLDGCPLQAVMFYASILYDHPVMARLSDGRCVLLIGFNEQNTILFDPTRGTETVYRYGMNDSTRLFHDSGNHFLTYID